MKMICEVPDEVIKCIKDGTWCGSSVAEKMIANGIPLSSSEEPCEDAIRRQAVLDATVKTNSVWNSITNSKGENLEEIISQLPPVNQFKPICCPSMGIDCENCPAYEPKTGHWEWVRYDGIAGNWHCSECRTIIPHMPEETDNTPIYKWCPMCGAKMQEVKDNG